MIDELFDNVNKKSNELINDVQKRTSTIIESTVNLSIDNGKKRIDELRKSFKSELDNIEERLELLKKNNTADFEQNIQIISSRILSEKEKFESSAYDIKNKLYNSVKLLQHDTIETIQNEKIKLQSIINESKEELEVIKQSFLDELELSFLKKLEYMIADNKVAIIKILIKSIFNFKKV